MDTGVVDVPSVDTLPPPETGAPEAPAGDSGGDANTEAGCAMGAPCGTTCCSAGEVCVGGSCQQDQPCTVASDCSSGCCAPATDSAGHPLGPYVCKPNDANPYDCCYGLFNSCGNGFCCVQDNNSNEFCAAPCTMNSDCAPAKCDPFMFSITHTTCPGPTACGP